MASPAGNSNQLAPFDTLKLFKTPNPNPNPNFSSPSPFPPSPPPPHVAFSYPPPTPPFHHHALANFPAISHLPNPNPNHGARLMALLGTAPPPPPESTSSSPQMHHPKQPVPVRLPSGKMPRGRQLGGGDHSVYDVDLRLPGESKPPQLEVTPITKYISDPGLVLGRQIAVNGNYICYGLKMGNIRVLDVNTALRALLRGHTQRVTDMAFFAEDVHLLASASVDGRIYVWKLDEGPDQENKPQITGKLVIAIQIVGDLEAYHPRICWHSHKQEILLVGIGNHVLKVDTTKVGKGKVFSADEPLKCPFNKLIDGVHLIGKHDGEVTDLSISQWMTTRLASSSKDGTVKIWDDRKATPLVTLKPHDGQPVNSVEFLTSPHRPDHIVLVTAGPFNREVKIWVSASEEGWLLPSDSELWKCTQTLELKSSIEPRPEEAFFNQIIVLPRASLLLVANAKKKAIYAVHVNYGPCPDSTRMDYIADFTVAMPILSLTGTCDNLIDGDQVQVYCVQTHAIQQYSLDLSQCMPDPNDSVTFVEKNYPDMSSFSSEAVEPTVNESPINTLSNPILPVSSSGVHESISESPTAPSPSIENGNSVHAASPTKRFEKRPSLGDHNGDQTVLDYSINRKVDTLITTEPVVPILPIDDASGKDESKAFLNDISSLPNPALMFRLQGNVAHLITPAEILSGAIPSEITLVNNDMQSVEPKDETAESRAVVTESCIVEESQSVDSAVVAEALERTSRAREEESQRFTNNMLSQNITKDSSNELEGSATAPSAEAVSSQIVAMEEKLNQLISMHKEMQRQMSTLATVPVTKEGKRLETALGRSMDKAVKANVDALWARCQEENVKHEKAEKDRLQHITNLITNSTNKDMPTILERALKKEITSVGPSIARAITPVVEKAISSAIADSFQKGVGDKAVSQLEKSVNSKLESTLVRQIQVQFQTSGKQALQDALRSNLESSMIPAFELSCKTMFEQVDATFHKGVTEYASAAQQHFQAAHTPLAHTLRDAINTASSITQNIAGELADGQHKLIALLTSGIQKDQNPLGLQQPISVLPEMVEAPPDPRKELTRLLSEHKYDDAFSLALHSNDVSTVSWLCSQIDLPGICSMSPPPLSQRVMLALLQQLACDISNDTTRKLGWMTIVAVAINPMDPNIALYIRPILEQVYNILAHQRSTSEIRAIMHVINSVLMSCK